MPNRENGGVMQIAQALLDLVAKVPNTTETPVAGPGVRSREIAGRAALRAAATSAAFSIPPGPVGLLTVVPDLVAIWRIQAQMVADIAGVFGKSGYVTREQMLYCLFRHAAAQGVRDLVVRMGERFLIRRVSSLALETAARSVGARIARRILGKTLSRLLPIVGALGVGAYAYYDTAQVAATAIEMFEREIEIEPAPGESAA